MYAEDDLLPVSALYQIAYCERRCALMHIEGVWEENRFTVEGRQLHERVDEGGTEVRGDMRIARGLRIRSLRLGLAGRADVVEFRRLGPDQAVAGGPPLGVTLDGVAGLWLPFPVEYKRSGRTKVYHHGSEIQLCAQALCLEEMLDTTIPAGALFYGKEQKRRDVVFTDQLRSETEALCRRLHELFASRRTPPPRCDARCRNCSLRPLCIPEAASPEHSARQYLERTIAQMVAGE